MEILGIFNERPGILEAAKKGAEPYLDKDPLKAWLAFVKVMRDNGQNDVLLAIGTVQVLRASVTVEQVRKLIEGFR